jgi:single-strand DNA-binding protein
MSIPIQIKGNVGTDPEIKFSKANKAWATFSLAYTPRTKQGETWIDGDTMWFRVVQFGEKAEQLVDLVSKGDKVFVVGSWKQSTYTNKEGVEKINLEINATDIYVAPKADKKPRHVEEEVAPW